LDKESPENLIFDQMVIPGEINLIFDQMVIPGEIN
jgi:hypothetical protein